MDLAIQFLRQGYRALPDARATHGDRDAFEAVLLGRRAVVVRGREGVRQFYDTDLVERESAVPAALANLLFGRGAVHGTDGMQHRVRKQMFMALLTVERVADLTETIRRDLEARVATWRGRDVVVFDELVEVYGAAVLAWAGVEVSPGEAARTSHRLAAIVDGFGGAGRAYPRAWLARMRSDRWATNLVARVRSGRPTARPGSILAEIASGVGAGLEPGLAGVELLNILRPTVAVAWPGTFLARELTIYPHWRALVGRPDDASAFEHEVRRTCPFVPALAGRARRDGEVGGITVGPGDAIVLDVRGTNHDPAWWAEPERFLPERFGNRAPDPFAFVPQGGGYPETGHRCPGEPLTSRILTITAQVLAGVDYHPTRDTDAELSRMPTLPAGGLPVRV